MTQGERDLRAQQVAAGPLQFKVLQTYDNGDVDRWIEDATEGADNPGPVVDVVEAAPGSLYVG